MKLLIEIKNLTKRSVFITHDNVIQRWLKVADKTQDSYTGSALGPRFVFNLKKQSGEIVETRYSDNHIFV